MGFWVGSRSVQGLTLARNPGSGDTGYTVDQGRVGSGPGRIPKPGTTLIVRRNRERLGYAEEA